MDEWTKKLWCIYTMEYYSAIRKNEIFPSAILMDLTVTVLSKTDQTEKEKYSK